MRRRIQATTHQPRQGEPAVRGTARDSLPGTCLPSLATVAIMKDVRGEIREFLTTRRAKLTPEQAGLPRYAGRRRVAGLRRDEAAQLAGISIEYYTRLEPAARHQPARAQVRPSVQRLLDSMTNTAAFLRNGRLDILAANQLGHALYSPVFDSPVSGNPRRPANLARFIFLDERSAQFYRDRDGIARQAVGSLHAEAGRAPHDRALAGLVGELSVRSQQFRALWAGHDVVYYRSGVQPFHHPQAGDLDLDYDALEIPADPGQTIIAYSAEPGSAARDALDILASWAATQHQAGQPEMTHPADTNAPR